MKSMPPVDGVAGAGAANASGAASASITAASVTGIARDVPRSRSFGAFEPLPAGVFDPPLHATKVMRTRLRSIWRQRVIQLAKIRKSSRRVGDRPFVHLVEQVRVLLLDDLALHLQRRRELARFDR